MSSLTTSKPPARWLRRATLWAALVALAPISPLRSADAAEAPRPAVTSHTFAGASLTQERAARLAFSAGVELISAAPCSPAVDGCTRIAVRGKDGTASIYELSSEPCAAAGTDSRSERPRRRRKARSAKAPTASCFGGWTVTDYLQAPSAKSGRPAGSTAKISAAPGEDGLPPDPQDEAQADATNEIIEALGDGKYDGDYEQFWHDFESIQTWQNPAWEEPDPPPPETIEGRPLPDALDICRPERRSLERYEPRCEEPWLAALDAGTCSAERIPSFEPATDNLVISNWDWELGRFVYFGPKHPEPTPEDVDFLVAVWNFLVENRDIAEWSICLVEGPSNGNCIEKRLDGRKNQPFEFVDRLPIGCPAQADMCTAFIGTKTSILLSFWQGYREAYFNASSDTERLCRLARMASLLVHEILHSCLAVFTQNADDFGLGPGECGCDTPDMAESGFAHAVAERYPCLLNTNGCAFYGDDDMWVTPCDFGYGCAPPCG